MLYKEYLKLDSFQIHKVGNKTNNESLILGKSDISVNDDIKKILLAYFLSSFKSEEYYHFYHDSILSMNEVYTYVSTIFDNPIDLLQQSVNLAKHLYNQSTHPKIKGGELYVVYFKDCIINGETVDAIGLFKSENKETFLKVFSSDDNFEIESEQGININKLDKGCVIFNSEKEKGFIVSVVDNTNKGSDAQYWIDDFLKLKVRNDNYNQTNTVLKVYKDFVTNKIDEEFEISKTDKIDLLNRSIKYFKEKDHFDLDEFSNEVLANEQGIESFKKFKKNYESEFETEIGDSFLISDTAVKKQARVFKSVLKLDKNFHIYIHGNKELIEKGYDEEMKMSYYKVYFKEEN
jgi:hypothetical protein